MGRSSGEAAVSHGVIELGAAAAAALLPAQQQQQQRQGLQRQAPGSSQSSRQAAAAGGGGPIARNLRRRDWGGRALKRRMLVGVPMIPASTLRLLVAALGSSTFCRLWLSSTSGTTCAGERQQHGTV